MSTTIDVVYRGGGRLTAVHGPSGAAIDIASAPEGAAHGGAFAPTDLTPASLAACVLSVMAAAAEARGLSIEGAHATVVKEMSAEGPRRIARLPVCVTLPATVPPDRRKILEAAARACPIKRSLHPDVEVTIALEWEG